MLKKVSPSTVIILLFITASMPASLKAADLSIGATAWYTAWDYEDDASSSAEYSPSFLYGPAFALSITERLNLSFVFLYGEFDMDMVSETIPIKRYDSDLAMNYRITDYFKLFLGCKYAGFTWGTDGKHQAIGPGAGISAIIPVGGNFFILGNLSGLYLWGEEGGEKETDYNASAREYGFNTNLSLAYYIADASTTISLGGRFQQLHIDYNNTENGAVSDSTSRFYGVTLTAVHSFKI